MPRSVLGTGQHRAGTGSAPRGQHVVLISPWQRTQSSTRGTDSPHHRAGLSRGSRCSDRGWGLTDTQTRTHTHTHTPRVGRAQLHHSVAMRCLVTGGNVKVLGKAVHSLSRIGDELYVDPTEDGLSLRAVNSSRSAYACFLFAPLFFQLYEEGSPDPDGEPFRCKVFMKSFLGVFRSLPSLEKMVEKCLISLNPRASRLVVQLHCKYGVTKTHNLSFQECELLQAVFDKELCANTLRAPARVLVDAVVHFPVTLAEVTLGVSPAGKVSFRNYLDEETEPSRTMVTELCLSEDEFQDVQVQQQSHVTFCLKEFRAGHLHSVGPPAGSAPGSSHPVRPQQQLTSLLHNLAGPASQWCLSHGYP
ncbi:cell cycle checkpoint control protein RAD9A isoform X3 [Malaclemys terrapin pileata]|uniref:cell cycle checkpoint control protein RAD9A isoform X3 n=1 Tax=Malaclemys terrapin pileata TaxID=2991368 RepID=UPI0023A8C2B6|nr:cell cycle checkpoint control protein RAD9A isoform X3 [Malaclemys terrapin pileata]